LSASPIRQPEPAYRDRLLQVGEVPDAWVVDLEDLYEVTAIPTLGAFAAVRAQEPEAVLLRVEEGGLELLRELAGAVVEAKRERNPIGFALAGDRRSVTVETHDDSLTVGRAQYRGEQAAEPVELVLPGLRGRRGRGHRQLTGRPLQTEPHDSRGQEHDSNHARDRIVSSAGIVRPVFVLYFAATS